MSAILNGTADTFAIMNEGYEYAEQAGPDAILDGSKGPWSDYLGNSTASVTVVTSHVLGTIRLDTPAASAELSVADFPLTLAVPAGQASPTHLEIAVAASATGPYTTVYQSAVANPGKIHYFDEQLGTFVAVTSSGIPVSYAGRAVVVDVSDLMTIGKWYRYRWVQPTVSPTVQSDWYGGHYLSVSGTEKVTTEARLSYLENQVDTFLQSIL